MEKAMSDLLDYEKADLLELIRHDLRNQIFNEKKI